MSATLTPAVPNRITPEEMLLLPGGGRGYELIDGELRERTMSFLSNYVGAALIILLGQYCRARNLGWISGSENSYKCFPNHPRRIRKADVSFHRIDRYSPDQATSEGHCTVAPDLVVEVISPNDTAYEVNSKRLQWLDAGVRLVWVVDPVEQTVHAYHLDGRLEHFSRTDTLTAVPVLPDFSTPMAEIFRLPGRS